MNRSSSGLLAYARTEEARKKLRYAGASALFVPVGQSLTQALGLWLDNYTAASLLAVAILTVPFFFVSKHLVWRVTSRENLPGQMLVFWVAVILGVSLSTLFTYLVENEMAGQTRLVCGTAVFVAQLLGYGIVWIGRFLILDRWLFKLAGETPEHVDAVIGAGRHRVSNPLAFQERDSQAAEKTDIADAD
jgi:hypothetical protein